MDESQSLSHSRWSANTTLSSSRSAVTSPFRSLDDLIARVPLLNCEEQTLLTQVGALNSLEGIEHRRDAL